MSLSLLAHQQICTAAKVFTASGSNVNDCLRRTPSIQQTDSAAVGEDDAVAIASVAEGQLDAE